VRALPAVIAEPVEEAPEPLPEPAPPPEEVVPPPEEVVPPPEEVVPPPEEVLPPPEKVAPKPPRKPKRRPKTKAPKIKARPRRRRRPVLAASAAVLLLAGGLGAGVAVVLGKDPTAAEQEEPQTRGPTTGVAGAVVVADSNGEGHACTVTGTAGDDLLEGTGGDDVLCGLGGNDVLAGKGGADVLLAGAGDDTVTGGPGSDRLDGGPGMDTLRALDGSPDEIAGGPGADQADAGGLDRPTGVEAVSDPALVAAGDVACDPLSGSFHAGRGTAKRCRQAYTGALVQRLEPHAVLVLGDAQYEDALYWKYRRSYHPTWGRFKEISHPTPASGHDRFGGGGFRRYWGARARPEGELWYSFDVGGWHVVSLNSNCPGIASCDAGSTQEQWLRADLAAHPNVCTLAFWHEPRFSSAGKSAPKMTAIWQALYDAGAELVLSADAHNYERFEPMDPAGVVDPRGVRQFVVGTGGKSLVPFKERVPGSLIRNARTFGVLKLTLHPKSYDWRFVRESGSLFTDAGSADCR
ncbi:MAG: hypothetical protein ACRDON_01655, partial [Gaiellaceae bacterium]